MNLITGPYPDEYRTNKPRILDIEQVETGTEPLSLADIKAWLRVDSTDEDTLIEGLISACRAALEEFCAISIIEKEITVTAEWGGEWELPYGPVQSVNTVSWRNGNDYDAWTLNDNYYLDGTLFKRLRANNCQRLQISYIAGYTNIPKDLMLDLKRVIAYCYEHRGDEALSSLQGGFERPKQMDDALELFAAKHRRMLWL